MDQVVRVSKRCDRATVWSRNIFQRLRNICIFNASMHNFSPFYFFFFGNFCIFLGLFCPILFAQNFQTQILVTHKN